MPVLLARDLTIGYQSNPLLQDIQISVARGEIVGLIGANGSGKSTLLQTISGLLPPICGSIEICGKRVNGMPAWRRVKDCGLGYVMQQQRNFPTLTVGENLHLAFWHANLGWRERERRITEVLEQEIFKGLLSLLNRPAHLLSGGEDLLLAIAKSVFQGGALLLLDEPTAGLHDRLRPQIEALLRSLSRTRGILLVEQSFRVVFSLSSRVYALMYARSAEASTVTRVVQLSEESRLRIRETCQSDSVVGVNELTTLFSEG